MFKKLIFACINSSMIVYKLTNKINGKFYIGITTGDMKQRLRGHRQSTNPHLTSAMNKYGKENFIIEQLDTAKTNKELDRKEVALIKKLKPHYNMQEGGREFFHHTEESKRKIGKGNMVAKLGNQYRLGKKFTTKSKEKISESLRGNTNKLGKIGAKLSLETRKKMSKAKSGKNNPAKQPWVREKLRQAALRRYSKVKRVMFSS